MTRKRRLRRVGALVLVPGLVLLASSVSHAAFVITIDEGADGDYATGQNFEMIIMDNAGANTLVPGTSLLTTHEDEADAAGAIVFWDFTGGNFVDFNFSVSNGITKPTLDAYWRKELQTTTDFQGKGTLDIAVTDTDYLFYPPIDDGQFQLTALVSRSGDIGPDDQITSQSYLDLNNRPFGMDGAFTLGSLGPLDPANGSSSAEDGGRVAFDPTTPFSLTQTFHMVFENVVSPNVHGETMVLVPEPVSMAAWSLLAGLGIALGWRRRRKAC